MRKEDSGENEDRLLVMFPAAKNYPLEIDDPLEDLMREFESLEDSLELELDEEEEIEAEVGEEKEVTGRIQLSRILTSRKRSLGDKIGLLRSKMGLLKDTRKRNHYYLGELQGYLPNKK